MELKTNNTYIFKWKKSSYSSPFKGQVEDQTEKTIKVTNLDTGISFREMKDKFNNQWEAIELVSDFLKELRKITKEIGFSPINLDNDTWVRRYCSEKCYCDGSCNREEVYTGINYYKK